jgi:hypothetical protein
MNDELERIGKDAVMGTCYDQDWNQLPLKYERRALQLLLAYL